MTEGCDNWRRAGFRPVATAATDKPVVYQWTCEACGHPTAGYPTRSERVEEHDRIIVYMFHGDC